MDIELQTEIKVPFYRYTWKTLEQLQIDENFQQKYEVWNRHVTSLSVLSAPVGRF
jgi:hypothetical protein